MEYSYGGNNSPTADYSEASDPYHYAVRGGLNL